MPASRQAEGASEVIGFLIFAPIATAGVVWLGTLTALDTIRSNFALLAFIAVLAALLGYFSSSFVVRTQATRFGTSEVSLASVAVLSGLFLLGPVVLWIPVLLAVFQLLLRWNRAVGLSSRWNLLRSWVMDLSAVTLGPLIALQLYDRMGGSIPIEGLIPTVLLLAVAVLLLNYLVQVALGLLYVSSQAAVQKLAPNEIRRVIPFKLYVISVPQLANPFGVLAAGLNVESGIFAYLFFCAGLLLVAVLARQLSRAAVENRQQSEAHVALEGLSNDLISSTPDETRLTRLMAKHLPNMLPIGNLAIWRLPDQMLYRQPDDWSVELDAVWPWLAGQSSSALFLPGDRLPWEESLRIENPVVVTPVLENSQPIGAIYLSLRRSRPWDRASAERMIPVTQSLASLIASAFGQSEAYATDLRLKRISQELQLAGEIQSSLIPFEIPRLHGWRISVTLNPAQETSGDFFDLIPLPDGKLGLIIADVVDKGVGAALYMALSRTLLRTYAIEADSDPDLVFFATNSRMLADTTSNLFVTAFYGVLDPANGQLTYCNAGHNPPYLVRPGDPVVIQELIRTGMPIGIQEGATWRKAFVQLRPGDRLLLYTDGVPDSRSAEGEYLTTNPMLDIAKENLDLSAEDLQLRILQEISDFVGDAPQLDDITLMILARDRET